MTSTLISTSTRSSKNRTGQTFDPVHIAGIGTTSWLPEHDAVIDELVYLAVSDALGAASINRHEIGLTVTASMEGSARISWKSKNAFPPQVFAERSRRLL